MHIKLPDNTIKNEDAIMEESKVLENALENCEYLQTSLKESLKMVRRLNLRYNIDWFVENYSSYISSTWQQYKNKMNVNSKMVDSHIETAHKKNDIEQLNSSSKWSKSLHPTQHSAKCVSARNSSELLGGNGKINYKFIRIKRSMETLLLQMERAIRIANRQRNYMHLNQNANQSKSHICCH